MKGARTFQAANIRLPEDLMLWIKHAAIDNRRSLTSEIQVRLEESRRAQAAAQETKQ